MERLDPDPSGRPFVRSSAMHSGKLPITGPCPIDLDAIGFDRKAKKAHCTHCVKSVHNLSNMTEGEAKDFLKSVAGQRVCVSYSRDTEGKIKFKPAQSPAPVVPISRLRPRRSMAAPVAAGVGLAAALAACTPHAPKPQPETQTQTVVHEEVGKIEVEPRRTREPVYAGAVAIPDPEPEPLAGDVAVPEDVVDGEMIVPREPIEEPMEGEIEVPPEGIDEPCDGKKSKKTGVTPPPSKPIEGGPALLDLGKPAPTKRGA